MAAAKTAFRGLLRAAKELCGDDKQSLQRARAEIRSHFDKSRSVRDATEVNRLLNDAREAEEFITRNLVQARLNKRGSYEVKLKDPDAPTKELIPEKHVDFEPLPPQVAIEKTQNPAKKSAPSVTKQSALSSCQHERKSH